MTRTKTRLAAACGLATSGWTALTNFAGNGETNRVLLPIPVDVPGQIYRVSQPLVARFGIAVSV